MDIIKRYLKDILVEDGKGTNYYVLANASNKVWIIPMNTAQYGIEIYEPTSIKGKAIKAVIQNAPSRVLGHLKCLDVVRIDITSELLEDISKLFGEDYNCSFYMGDIRVEENRKLVIQIYNGSKILAYGKVTNVPDLKKLFVNEIKTLNYLNASGISGIPKVYGVYKSLNGKFIAYYQSTVKTINSKIVLKLQNEHFDFQENLYEATKKICVFNETDIYSSIEYLKVLMQKEQDHKHGRTILDAIDRVAKFYGQQEHVFSFSHRDFTPWNMIFERDSLFVFDFEYSKFTYPPYIDLVHFAMQVDILHKGLDSNQINKRYDYYNKLMNKYSDKPGIDILAYLLDQISFHYRRNNGMFDINDNGHVIWFRLIQYILNN